MNPVNDGNLVEQYQKEKQTYIDFTETIADLIKKLLNERKISFHKIDFRTKESEKLREKITRKGQKYSSLNEITDLAGIRVITFFEDDVDEVADLIGKEFTIDTKNGIDKRIIEADKFGYRSLHTVAGINPSREELAEWSRFKGLKFEIQIRSVLQHAWAEIEHDIGYKGEHEIPNLVRRHFSQVAALLEVADIQFVNIRKALSSYEKSVENKIKTMPEEVEINSASLKAFVLSDSVVRSIDEAITRSTNITLLLDEEPDLHSTVKRMDFLGIKTIKELDSVLDQKKTTIIDFAKAWLYESTTGTVRLGLSLFYLGYVLVAEKNDLDFATEYYRNYVMTRPVESAEADQNGKDILRIYKSIAPGKTS